MSIIDFIAEKCVQTAVYWGNPQNDGSGGLIFDDPIEINCMWEDVIRQVEDKSVKDTAEIFVSKSQVFVLQDVDEGGYLYLGTLDDLYDVAESSTTTLDPLGIKEAYMIRKKGKIPRLGSSTEFIRMAYL
jgi:hypothetical protein